MPADGRRGGAGAGARRAGRWRGFEDRVHAQPTSLPGQRDAPELGERLAHVQRVCGSTHTRPRTRQLTSAMAVAGARPGKHGMEHE